jgi:hypothetical protein
VVARPSPAGRWRHAVALHAVLNAACRCVARGACRTARGVASLMEKLRNERFGIVEIGVTDLASFFVFKSCVALPCECLFRSVPFVNPSLLFR